MFFPPEAADAKRHHHRRATGALGAFLLTLLGATGAQGDGATRFELPAMLSETGLFVPGSSTEVRSGVLAFSPQYPLWSDGADKRRWLQVPGGSFIDGADPDRWVFPPGTRLWKEFSHAGRRVETRYIRRTADGSWQYATYVWNEDGSDAVLAPPRGVPALRAAQAPGGSYAIPSRTDCLVCHESAAVPVLGVGSLQLSAERDPLATQQRSGDEKPPDLRTLVDRGLLRRLPDSLLARPPRIAARSAGERAALGYLHANCGHCHNDDGARVPVSLVLAQRVDSAGASLDRVLGATVDAPSRYRPPGRGDEARQVVPGRPEDSVLAIRMASRHPQVQMPPLGTRLPDPEGLALIRRWITNDLSPRKELQR